MQRSLSVMVRRMLRTIPRQLRDLDLPHQIPLKTREQNLPLARLQPVHHARQTPHVVHVQKVYHLLVHKIPIPHRVVAAAAATPFGGGGRVIVLQPVPFVVFDVPFFGFVGGEGVLPFVVFGEGEEGFGFSFGVFIVAGALFLFGGFEKGCYKGG